MTLKLSDYSAHFRNLSQAEMEKNVDVMSSRVEEFRLRLDLEYIVPWINGPDVLDFPIGVGRLYPHLMATFNVFGYEIAAPYVEMAKQRHPQIADHFAICSFEEIRRDRKFNTVISLRVMGNIANLELATANISSILDLGGRWIFVYPPNREKYKDIPDIVSRCGLRIIHRQQYDFHSSMRSMSRLELGVYGRLRRGIDAGWVPYWMFRTIEAVYGFCRDRGTCLFVCEKR